MDKPQEHKTTEHGEDASNKYVPDDMESLIDNYPPEIIKQSLTIASIMQNSPESSISEKITEEHIGKYLDSSHRNMELSYQDKNKQRIFTLLITLMLIGLIISIMIIFKSNPEMVEKILYAIGGFLAGSAGGYGYGRSKSD